MWQTEFSTTMKSVDTTGSVYTQNCRQGDWQQYLFCQDGDGADVPTKERDLMKIDMLALVMDFTYITYPDRTPDHNDPFKIFSTRYSQLYLECGWVNFVLCQIGENGHLAGALIYAKPAGPIRGSGHWPGPEKLRVLSLGLRWCLGRGYYAYFR